MNWLEIIGLMTVIFIVIGFINDFIEKKQKTDQQNAERIRAQDMLVAESREREALQEKWRRENPDKIDELVRNEERVRLQNQDYYRKQAEIHALGEKFIHAKPEDRQAIFDKLKELDPNKWGGKLWESIEPDEPSSQEVAASDQSDAIRSADDIIREFNISNEELVALYSGYKFSLGMSGASGGWNDEIEDFSRSICALSDEEISMAKANMDQAILNRIIIRLVADQKIVE